MGPQNGLVLSCHEAIIWINDSLVILCIYALLYVNELNSNLEPHILTVI